MTYTFDWGDQTNITLGPMSQGTLVSANHIWPRGGVYLIRVRAIDSCNSSSGWSGTLRVVINAPPQPPSAPKGPASGLPGTSYGFATLSTDLDVNSLLYTFEWGDGSTATTNWTESGIEVSLFHAWNKTGTYRIRAMATDSNLAASAWSDDSIVIINSPPNAPSTPSGPSFGFTGEAYGFLASASDPDGDRMTLSFDWGDGNISTSGIIESGAEARMEHAWNKSGTYQAKVSATDARGASSTWSRSLTITINTPPHSPAKPSGPVSGYAWVPYGFMTSAADPDLDSLTYAFDWGDGTDTKTDFVESGGSITAAHVWNRTGSFLIRADATDSKGTRAGWSEPLCITIAANDRPAVPRDLYGLGKGYTGINYTYFTLAEDCNGDRVRYTIDWGDSGISCTDYVDSGSLESASHIWSRPGEYLIRANATDERGAPSEWSEPLLVVIEPNKPPNPPARPSGPTDGQCLKGSRYSTSASDPDGDPVKYVFDWGDGTTTWTGMDYMDSGNEGSVYHKWTKPGTYLVKATAMDNKGTVSEWSKELAVKIS